MHKNQRKHGILSCRAGLDGRTDGNVNWTVLMMVQIHLGHIKIRCADGFKIRSSAGTPYGNYYYMEYRPMNVF